MATAIIYASTTYGIVGTAISLTPDFETELSNFSVDILPAGMSINESTGEIAGTPGWPFDDNPITVTADASGYGQLDIKIIAASYVAGYYKVGQFFGISIDIAGMAFTPSNFNISPSLPPGFVLNTSSGLVNGTATAISIETEYVVTFEAPDETVFEVPLSLTPMNVTYTAPTGTVGTPYYAEPIIIGSEPTNYIVFSDEGLPDGLSINGSTGVISGTPTSPVDNMSIMLLFSIGYFSFYLPIHITVNDIECLHGSSMILTSMGYKPVNTLTTNDNIITNQKKTRKIKTIHTILAYLNIGLLYPSSKKYIRI